MEEVASLMDPINLATIGVAVAVIVGTITAMGIIISIYFQINKQAKEMTKETAELKQEIKDIETGLNTLATNQSNVFEDIDIQLSRLNGDIINNTDTLREHEQKIGDFISLVRSQSDQFTTVIKNLEILQEDYRRNNQQIDQINEILKEHERRINRMSELSTTSSEEIPHI